MFILSLDAIAGAVLTYLGEFKDAIRPSVNPNFAQNLWEDRNSILWIQATITVTLRQDSEEFSTTYSCSSVEHTLSNIASEQPSSSIRVYVYSNVL
jgi:hypothetical protein